MDQLSLYGEEDEFGWNPLDTVGDIVDAAEDLVSSIWDRIPGSEHIDAATKAVISGPLKAFAQTGVGEFLLNVIAANAGNAAMFIAGPIGGPVLLISSAAIPGIAAGGDFGTSLANGWTWRLETAAQIVGPQIAAHFGKYVGEAAHKAVDAARKAFPNLDAKDALDAFAAQGIDAEKMLRDGASSLGIPATVQDAEAWAIKQAGALGVTPAGLLQAIDLNSGTSYFDMDRWDLATGQRKGPQVTGAGGRTLGFGGKPKAPQVSAAAGRVLSFGKAKPVLGATPMTICQQYEAAKARKMLPAVVEALRLQCEREKAKGAAMVSKLTSTAASNLASGVARASNTLAAQAAVNQSSGAAAASDPNVMAQNVALQQTAQKAADTKSTVLGAVAGVAGAAIGTGASLLAGLSATVAAPIGIGFGLGAGIGTKLLTRK